MARERLVREKILDAVCLYVGVACLSKGREKGFCTPDESIWKACASRIKILSVETAMTYSLI
jgi:hypothetical protein